MSRSRARAVAIRTLTVEATAGEVLGAFAAGRCRSILLKGSTLQRELYDVGTPRRYEDTDLLVAPDDLERAGTLLAALGFEMELDHSRYPNLTEPHAQEWRRARDGQSVDLHWRVAGIGAAPEHAWSVLVGRAQPIYVAGAPAERLDRVSTALLIPVHAAHHGSARGNALQDLELALARFERETWREAALLAGELEAEEAFGAGLRLSRGGEALASELSLPAVTSRRRRLIAADPVPGAFGALRIVEAPTLRARLRVAAREMFPAPARMRSMSPLARRGPAGLAASYPLRILTRAWRLPQAMSALRVSRHG